jgi:hypothetical protein
MTVRKKVEAPIAPLPDDYPNPMLELADPDALSADTIDKVNAGARLTFAIFLHPQARELFASPLMTPQLRDAYIAAARAWGL